MSAGAAAAVGLLSGLLRLVRVKVCLHRRFVKIRGLTLLNQQGSLRADAKTGAKPVAQSVGNETRLAVNYLQGTFGTGRQAGSAAVTLFLVDADNLSFHVNPPSCLQLCSDYNRPWQFAP